MTASINTPFRDRHHILEATGPLPSSHQGNAAPRRRNKCAYSRQFDGFLQSHALVRVKAASADAAMRTPASAVIAAAKRNAELSSVIRREQLCSRLIFLPCAQQISQLSPPTVREHDPEKACPGLDPGWIPVFGKDHAQNKEVERDGDLKTKSSRSSLRGPRATERLSRCARSYRSSIMVVAGCNGRVVLDRPASRTRYYVGLAIVLVSWLPAYFYAYLPQFMPGGNARIYILAGMDLAFVASVFLMGGEFWQKVRRIFIYEGRV